LDPARNLLGRYLKNLAAKKIFLVTDNGIISSGWLDDIVEILEYGCFEYEIYSNINSNPCVEEVMEGARVYNDKCCDVIVSIGGGSPMDCAKGVGIVISNNKHIKEFEGVDKVVMPSPPLICIPTTAGSSADVSQFAIISDKQRKIKMAIISKKLVPDVALIDPVTTTTMNSNMTVNTGFDILSHSIEAYVSNASSPITDVHSIEAIKLFSSNILECINDPKNPKFRGNLMLASLHAGLAFSNASLGLVHAMAHSLGGLMDLPHGECNALLLEHVLDFNFSSDPIRYLKISETMGFSDSKDKYGLINGISKLKIKTGLTKTLKDVGVREKDISKLTNRTMNDPCIVTNPVIPKKVMWRKYLKMPSKQSDLNNYDNLRDKIIGLGESSIQKSYYPELQKRLGELERFRALLDQSNDPIFLLKIPSGHFTDVNRSACELFGYSNSKMLQMSLEDLLNAEEMVEIQRMFDVLIENKESSAKKTFSSVFNRIDGHKIPVEIGASIVNFTNELYIVMVVRDITERKEAEDNIRASLEEKKVLLREIHHRVKNNMQIISSLLNLQTRYIEDEKVVDILKESQNRVKSMAMIHETLYQSEGFAKIGFSGYVNNLVRYLLQSYVDRDHVNIITDLDEVFLDIDTAIPCGLIINELVTNSLKHAFPNRNKGQIRIGLMQSVDKFILEVKDNGIGFPELLDFRRTETLGLQLINSLVMQLDGIIELKNNNGTEFKIVFYEMNYSKRI
jgi:PAS domain S-box-containing protein